VSTPLDTARSPGIDGAACQQCCPSCHDQRKPAGKNTEGNGWTDISGGTYFVDQPEYIHVQGTLPAGTTDVRFRYSTDESYLGTGWFVDDMMVNGATTLSSEPGNGVLTDGKQNNHWVAQIIAPCDLTPGIANQYETIDLDSHTYRLEGDTIEQADFSTSCMKGSNATFAVAISNTPSGRFTVFDADYLFRVKNTGNSHK
jgi:hypothetical protein